MDSELIPGVRTLAMAGRELERAGGELTIAQYRVLLLVASSPDRASRLAERAKVSRPSLTGVLDALEAKGLLCRAQVEGDRRGVRLELTDRGRIALAEAEAAMAWWLGSRLVPGSQRRRVIDGLAALGQALDSGHQRCNSPEHQPPARR